MVKLTYLGHSSFKITSPNLTIITDPYDPDFTGLKWKKQTADVVTVSHQHQDHNYIAGVEGSPFIVHEPGEYEFKGVSVIGLQTFHDKKKGMERGENVVYAIHLDGLVIAHLGDLGGPLTSEQIEELNTIDALLVPVGGKATIDAEQASELIAQLEPVYVVPMHYKVPDLKFDFDPLDKFLEQMGAEGAVPRSSLDFKSKAALPEGTTVVVLEPK